MDNMLEHPGIELQILIREKGLTQKAFSSILGKKVSEVNELLKGKRNITIQRDYLLHQHLGTPIKYWILKQIDYDYSLLDIEETPSSSLLIGEGQGEVSQHNDVILSDSLSSGAGGKSTSQQTSHSEAEGRENPEISPIDKEDTSKPRGSEQQKETPTKESDSEVDEDFKKRAKIFRSF